MEDWNGNCSRCTEGSFGDQDKGGTQPDKEAAYMLRIGSSNGSAPVSFNKGNDRKRGSGNDHDHSNAALFLFCDV